MRKRRKIEVLLNEAPQSGNMQNSSQDGLDEKAREEALKLDASQEQVPGFSIEDGETTPKKSRPNVEAVSTKNYRVKHSDPTDDDDNDDDQSW